MSKYSELAGMLEGCLRFDEPSPTEDYSERTMREAAAALRELEQESERLKELLACAYQLAGTVGAPVRFLDAFSRGEGGIDSLLPVSYDEIESCARVQELERLLRRYRNETPLGHQPHMIAHEVDAALTEKPRAEGQP